MGCSDRRKGRTGQACQGTWEVRLRGVGGILGTASGACEAGLAAEQGCCGRGCRANPEDLVRTAGPCQVRAVPGWTSACIRVREKACCCCKDPVGNRHGHGLPEGRSWGGRSYRCCMSGWKPCARGSAGQLRSKKPGSGWKHRHPCCQSSGRCLERLMEDVHRWQSAGEWARESGRPRSHGCLPVQ